MKTTLALLTGLAAGSLFSSTLGAWSAQSDPLLRRIQQLERRVDALTVTDSAAPSTVPAQSQAPQGKAANPADPITGHVARFMAPFEVVDGKGRTIVRILDFSTFAGGVYAFNPAGQ